MVPDPYSSTLLMIIIEYQDVSSPINKVSVSNRRPVTTKSVNNYGYSRLLRLLLTGLEYT